MIDQIRASKLPSNMMNFAARGALSVTPEENLEILVYLARNNRVFGGSARMTLAGWDEKASLAAASSPNTSREVLAYLVEPENLRPRLLPALFQNPSVREVELARVAQSASPDKIALILQSARARSTPSILESLRSNPYLQPKDAATLDEWLGVTKTAPAPAAPATVAAAPATAFPTVPAASAVSSATVEATDEAEAGTEAEEAVPEDAVSAYLAEHASEISAEEGKPFQPIGGILELLGMDYFPVSAMEDIGAHADPVASASPTATGAAAKPARATAPDPSAPAKRENTMQKINGLDVKGRIQLALKGNKEERSILIRDGTKVVALAVLEAPKLSDGEVEKFALQKNVLEAVLRQIPLKRRFMKNYIVVRNLVANPRTPLDLSLGLIKHLLAQDLKNISANKEVSETVRKLALKMYKQKMDAANKK
jgi:hypothetical protein